MACDSPLDQKIKSDLISDTLTLTGIVPLDQRLYQNLPFNNASINVYEQKIKSQMSFKPNLSTKKKTDIQKNQPDEKSKIQKLAIKET